MRYFMGGMLFAFLVWLLCFVILDGPSPGGHAITDDRMAACEAHDLSARMRASLGCK